MQNKLIIVFFALLALVACKTDSNLEFSEREIQLKEHVAHLNESPSPFDRIELIKDHGFDHGLLLELSFFSTCCRSGNCSPLSDIEAELIANDILYDFENRPELKAFDGIIFKINDLGTDFSKEHTILFPSSWFR